MISLVNNVNHLKKTKIKKTIISRIKEFEVLGTKSSKHIFKELCFCLMTAGFNAKRSIYIQEKVGNGFLILSKAALAKKLKQYGHRFYNARAEYIYKARQYADSLKTILGSFNSEHCQRDWLVENIKGLGYKEASHFLRNIGCKDCAIIDFHIIDLLEKYKLIKRPKTLSKKNYLQIEDKLREIGDKSNLDLAQLDLYLWFKETGNVLK